MFIPTGGGPGSIPVANIAPGAAGQYLGGTGPSYSFPPGFEIGYTQITANANVTDTAEATATALISPGALTFDGAPVICEFFSPFVETPNAVSVTDFVVISLFEGATQIGRLAIVQLVNLTTGQGLQAPVCGRLRFTPTAGAHTYKVTAFCNVATGTPFIGAGAGGTGAAVAAYVRFTKV